MKRKKSPNMESPFHVPAVKGSKMAPLVPKRIPTAFVTVIDSFKTKNERITTKIGLKAIMIPELIEDDKFKPWKKNN